MDRKVKLAAAGGILFAGVAAAFLIGRPTGERTPGVPERPDPLVLREVTGPQFPDGTLPPGEPTVGETIADNSVPTPPRPPVAQRPARRTAKPPRKPAGLEPLPSMPQALPKATAVAPPPGLPTIDPEEPAVRSHKVVDGDTLSSLAEQYLGSASRCLEIYEANRDQLDSPELLPIGVRLRIPPQASVEVPGNLPATGEVAAEVPPTSTGSLPAGEPAPVAEEPVAPAAPESPLVPLARASEGPPTSPPDGATDPAPWGRLVPVVRSEPTGG